MSGNKDKELLSRILAEQKKARHNIFVKETNWKRIEEWGKTQNPPIGPSQVIDALIEWFFDEKKS